MMLGLFRGEDEEQEEEQKEEEEKEEEEVSAMLVNLILSALVTKRPALRARLEANARRTS